MTCMCITPLSKKNNINKYLYNNNNSKGCGFVYKYDKAIVNKAFINLIRLCMDKNVIKLNTQLKNFFKFINI